MISSDTMTDHPQPPAAGPRVLRRSRTNRVAAGVAGGLGDYFRLDPVLFRVLFATSAFFGGAGILAYLLAWAAIPEEGTAHAAVDRWIAALRARRFPVWLVLVVGGLLLWAAAFSWWAPGPFFPVVAIVVLLIVFFTRRELQDSVGRGGAPAPTVSLRKEEDGAPALSPTTPLGGQPGSQPDGLPGGQPGWVNDTRLWMSEMRELARERRRRSFPIRVGVLLTLVGALTTLGIADAISGIQLQWYFWTTLAVLGAGMLVAVVSRRWSWSLVPLVVPAAIGAIAFAGSDTSLHDGIGQRDWQPAAVSSAHYRLAFGQGVLDLRQLGTPARPARFEVTLGAGQVKVLAPKSLNLTVHADVHAGDVEINDIAGFSTRHSGVEFTRTIDPLPGATGAPVTVDVHLTDGNLTLDRS